MATKTIPDRDDPPAGPAYDADLAAWAHYQAMLLRSGQSQRLDRANIAEELEDVGHEQYDRLESAIRLVLMHLLKWDHQPERRSRSWTLTIRGQRRQIERRLAKNPSLKARLGEAIADAYEDARLEAAAETDMPLAALPATCPYDWAAITSRTVAWPDDQ